MIKKLICKLFTYLRTTVYPAVTIYLLIAYFDKCDLNDEGVCHSSVICEHFNYMLHGSKGCGVFKELKIVK